jgi:hypothetical protein
MSPDALALGAVMMSVIRVNVMAPGAHLRIPPDRAEPGGCCSVGCLDVVAVFVAFVDSGRDGRVAESVQIVVNHYYLT